MQTVLRVCADRHGPHLPVHLSHGGRHSHGPDLPPVVGVRGCGRTVLRLGGALEIVAAGDTQGKALQLREPACSSSGGMGERLRVCQHG